jgi:phage baseplate assembly protein V
MKHDQSEVERRLLNMVRVGTITAVDPANGRARVTFGGETESAWLPFTGGRVGGAKVWTPPTVGEQVVVMSPSGDTAQGIISGSIASDSNPAPSGDGGAVVLKLGATTVTVTASGATIEVGGVSMTISAGGVAITGGQVTHNGKNIGSTHQHSGIMPGPANTGPPV